MRTRSSPVLANTVATAPVLAVNLFSTSNCRFKGNPFKASAGGGLPAISTTEVFSGVNVPARVLWKSSGQAVGVVTQVLVRLVHQIDHEFGFFCYLAGSQASAFGPEKHQINLIPKLKLACSGY